MAPGTVGRWGTGKRSARAHSNVGQGSTLRRGRFQNAFARANLFSTYVARYGAFAVFRQLRGVLMAERALQPRSSEIPHPGGKNRPREPRHARGAVLATAIRWRCADTRPRGIPTMADQLSSDLAALRIERAAPPRRGGYLG